MSLNDRLTEYRASVQQVRNLIVSAHRTDAGGQPLWPPAETRLVTESAFLRFFIAWESFAEGALIDYMVGEMSITGIVFQRYVAPVDRSHAARIVVGTQRYFDYADPDRLRRLCALYLKDGEPFETVISSVMTDLFDLRQIRNAAAHLSSTTSVQLDGVATRKLLRPCANVTVYDLILATDPLSTGGESVFESYVTLLDTAAQRIAHG